MMSSLSKNLATLLTKLTVIFIFLISVPIQAEQLVQTQPSDKPNTKAQLEAISLQLKWRHQFQFAGYYAAKIKGFYEAEGLDVTIKERDVHTNNIEQVINGNSEYGIADSMIMLYQAKQAPVTIVSTIFQHSPQVFISLKSSNITSPYDIEGKNIAFYPKDTDGFPLLAMLHENGVNIDPQRIYIKSIPELLISRQVDVYPVYLSNEPFYFYQRGIDINIINPINFGVDFYGDLIFTNHAELKHHPKRVEAFKRASIKGWEYALKNKDEIINYIINDLKVNKTYEHLAYEAKVIEEAIQPESIPIGTTNPGRFEYIQRLFEKQKIINTGLDLKQGIYQPETHRFQLTTHEKEWIHFHPEVEVAMHFNEKAIAFSHDDYKYSETTKKVFNYLSAQTNLNFDFKANLTSQQTTERFNQGKLHIIPTVVSKPTNLKNYLLTPSYLEFPVVIATLKGENYIADLNKIGQKTLAIKNDPSITTLFKKHYPNLNPIYLDTAFQGIEAVKNKHVYGYIDHLPNISKQIQSIEHNSIQISGELPFNIKVRMAIHKTMPELHAIISKAIDAMDIEARENLTKSWSPIEYTTKTNYYQIGLYLSPALLAIIFVLFYSRKMQRLNKNLIKANAALVDTQKTLEANQARLEVLSVTDFLTGAYNRQHIEQVLKNEINRADRYKTTFSVLLIDLDNFKHINDTYGHLVGDDALKATYNSINEQIRKSDTIGRWGGEEFIVICPETDLMHAVLLAHKIIDKPTTLESAQNQTQTVSIGVAEFATSETPSTLIERADQKLYEAKKTGKNRACS